jgi:MYXO-CTERM domain-containing protein
MDFIERWFHVSPDGGSGATEATILLALCMLVAALVWRRQRRRAARL